VRIRFRLLMRGLSVWALRFVFENVLWEHVREGLAVFWATILSVVIAVALVFLAAPQPVLVVLVFLFSLVASCLLYIIIRRLPFVQTELALARERRLVRYVYQGYADIGTRFHLVAQATPMGMPAPLMALEGLRRIRGEGVALLERGKYQLAPLDVVPWIATVRQWEKEAESVIRKFSLAEAGYFAEGGAHHFDSAVFPGVVDQGQGGNLGIVKEKLRRLDEIIARLSGDEGSRSSRC